MNKLPPPRVRVIKTSEPQLSSEIEKPDTETMDSLTQAIWAGLMAGATEVSKQAVIDAYAILKKLLKKKLGKKHSLIEALDELEAAPQSTEGRTRLMEQVAALNVNLGFEIFNAIQTVLERVKES